MTAIQQQSGVTAQIGNPLLGQIRDFIDTDEPTPVDPLGIALRAVRGRAIPIAVIALVLAFLFATTTWFFITPTYQSTGVIRVIAREAKLLYTDSDDSRLRLWDAFVTAELHLMQSRPVLESAWQALNETPNRNFKMPEGVGDLARIIGIANSKGLVTVAARSGNPFLSAAAVNAVLDSYESYKDAARNRTTELRRSELDDRVNSFSNTLTALDESYLSIGGEHDITSLSKAHIAKTAQLEVLEERISELDITLAQMRQTGSAGAGDIRNGEIQRALLLDQAMAEMTYDRASRMANLSTLRRRYQPTHSIVLGAELQLATLEAAIDERREQITTLGNVGALTGGTSQSAQQSLDEMQAVRQKLSDRRTILTAEAGSLIEKLVNIRRVAAEQARVGKLLDQTKVALDEVLVESQAGLSRSIEVIARGKVPDGPIEDKRKPFTFGAALFGTLATMIAFILASFFYPRVRYSDDLEPRTAGRIAAVVREKPCDESELRRASFRIRNEIDMRRAGTEKPLVIGVAGVSPAGEPATMAAALTSAFAARDLNVLLIDADPNSTITRDFGLTDGLGLSDVIAIGTPIADAIKNVETVHGEIHVLGAGSCNLDHSGDQISTLAIGDFRLLIESVASRHDVVIVDLGVLAAGRHSALGASISDQFVLVTSTGDRKRSVANAGILLDRITPDRYVLALNRASSLDPLLDQSDEHEPQTHWPSNWLQHFRKT